jgi:hypothetical protein
MMGKESRKRSLDNRKSMADFTFPDDETRPIQLF